LVAVLAVNDFHVERKDGGLTFRFGSPPTQVATIPPDAEPLKGGGVPLTDRPTTALQPVSTDDSPVYVLPAGGPFMTRDEFNAYSANMTRTIVALMNDYGRENSKEVADVLSLAFSEFQKKQEKDYADLRGRIEELGYGMAEENMKTSASIEYLRQRNQQRLGTPVRETPEVDSKGDDR